MQCNAYSAVPAYTPGYGDLDHLRPLVGGGAIAAMALAFGLFLIGSVRQRRHRRHCGVGRRRVKRDYIFGNHLNLG